MKKNTEDITYIINSIKAIPAVGNILDTICLSTGMDLGVIAYVNDMEWVALAVRDKLSTGLCVGQKLTLHYTICSEVYDGHCPIVIPDIKNCTNQCWQSKLSRKGFESYISFPIFDHNGHFFGTLCTIDYKPVVIDTAKIKPLFELLSQLITFHLGSLAKIKQSEILLREEIKYSRRRDILLSVLGHDLKNPLSAVITLSQFLTDKVEHPQHRQTAKLIYDSSFRMKGLIDNILDFARSKLGSGIMLKKCPVNMDGLITQVLNEIQSSMPEREIISILELDAPLPCDKDRMAQVFSNLIGNAFRHGSIQHPIWIRSSVERGRFAFHIENMGREISPSVLKNIFKPFVRRKNQKEGGLGLGLFIAQQIVLAHGGELTVHNHGKKVTFSFWIPIS